MCKFEAAIKELEYNREKDQKSIWAGVVLQASLLWILDLRSSTAQGRSLFVAILSQLFYMRN